MTRGQWSAELTTSEGAVIRTPWSSMREAKDAGRRLKLLTDGRVRYVARKSLGPDQPGLFQTPGPARAARAPRSA